VGVFFDLAGAIEQTDSIIVASRKTNLIHQIFYRTDGGWMKKKLGLVYTS
jgi:hypothetical protein